MEKMEAALLKAIHSQATYQKKSPGDYIGDDGLLYCGVCHESKQQRGKIVGQDVVFSRACACDRKKRE